MSQQTGRSMILSVLLLVLLASASCSQPETTPTTVPAPAYWPTEGWQRSAPEEQGMDSQQLAQVLAEITKREFAINTVLVVRNGYLVMEANVWPFQPEARHMILSITKSVTSALVGMAIELLQSAILPAAISSAKLPPNPEGLAALQSQIYELARPSPQSAPKPTFPPMAAEISGKTYRLQGSRYNFNSFSLQFREDDAILELMMGAGDEGCTVGLDGVFRVTNTGGANDIACKGHWSDNHTFELDWTQIGANQRHVVTFSFEGRDATLIASSSTLGVIDRMTGSQLQ